MAATDKLFAGSIPEIYDRFLVPLIFESYARDLAERMARIPHGYHDVEAIRAELMAAGFGEISVETVDGKSRASSPRDPAIAYCEGTPLRNEIEARDASRLEDATKTAAEALERRFGTGPIEGRIRAHVIGAVC